MSIILPIACSAPKNTGDTGIDEPSTAFIGVTVLPMTDAEAVLPDRTVVVRGDRIVAIGERTQVRIPRDARRIDGAGRYLLPGLADMHVHLEYFERPDVLKLFIANGVTTVRNMDGRAYILEWRRAVRQGHLLGPNIYTAGPILDGDPPVLPDNTSIRTTTDARSAVVSQAAAGYDFVKVYTNLGTDAYRVVLGTARELGKPVAGHVPRGTSLDEVVDLGQSSIEHLTDLARLVEADDSPVRNAWHWSKLYAAMPLDTVRMAALASRLAAANVWITPTMIQASRAVAPADTIRDWLRSAGMTHVSEEGRDFWLQRLRRTTERMDDEDWSLVALGRQNRNRLTAALHAAGARLLVGTDTPSPFVVPGFSVIEELENFAKAGISPVRAIAAATRDAASFIGERNEWGTVEAGKRADLLLLDADPRTDITNLRHRVGVMVRGRWLPEVELQRMIADIQPR